MMDANHYQCVVLYMTIANAKLKRTLTAVNKLGTVATQMDTETLKFLTHLTLWRWVGATCILINVLLNLGSCSQELI